MDDFSDTLLAEITEFLNRHNMSPSRFGRESVRDTDVIQRVKECRITLKTARRLREFMAARPQPAAGN